MMKLSALLFVMIGLCGCSSCEAERGCVQDVGATSPTGAAFQKPASCLEDDDVLAVVGGTSDGGLSSGIAQTVRARTYTSPNESADRLWITEDEPLIIDIGLRSFGDFVAFPHYVIVLVNYKQVPFLMREYADSAQRFEPGVTTLDPSRLSLKQPITLNDEQARGLSIVIPPESFPSVGAHDVRVIMLSDAVPDADVSFKGNRYPVHYSARVQRQSSGGYTAPRDSAPLANSVVSADNGSIFLPISLLGAFIKPSDMGDDIDGADKVGGVLSYNTAQLELDLFSVNEDSGLKKPYRYKTLLLVDGLLREEYIFDQELAASSQNSDLNVKKAKLNIALLEGQHSYQIVNISDPYLEPRDEAWFPWSVRASNVLFINRR